MAEYEFEVGRLLIRTIYHIACAHVQSVVARVVVSGARDT